MPEDISKKLVIAISSRALFDLDTSNDIFEKEGIIAYAKYQIQHEEEILQPGVAFSLVKKLLALNKHEPLVEVILLSRNSADTGLRIFNSIQHHGLEITRAAFTNGENTYPYASAFGSHLFLSTNRIDVKNALETGCAAATILSSPTQIPKHHPNQLRIAFDGDAVLFSDESECVFQEKGFEAFVQHEKEFAHKPLSGGPFKGFLSALHRLQQKFPLDESPIRTALVTARSAPAHERIIHTFRAWDIRIDEALFLGGLDKGTFLKAFNADIFFDDQQGHCDIARQYVATGHVPHGVANKEK
ncbi:MAG: 5-nucleotidase [Gammaproteobacteria bacterium]|jgi:5'-nucleotidase|nr:5-nucleotidase [Gammaproteobacteria bacterium]